MREFVLFMILWAQLWPTAAKASEPCAELKTVEDVVQCAVRNHPDIRRAQSEQEVSEAAVQAARQLLNPELAVEALPGGEEGSTTEVVLSQSIELGAKRESRSTLARAQSQVVSRQLETARAQIVSETLVALLRLKQIQDEIHVLDEAIETGQIVQKQYGRLIRLNPEQEVSLSVLRISEEQHRLKRNDLLTERKRIHTSIEAAIGRELPMRNGLLLNEPKSWPKAPTGAIQAPRLQEAQAQIQVAIAEKRLADSQRWPDLAVGPKIEHQGGSRGETRIGLALSLPLPVFNSNQAGVEVAEAGRRRAEVTARGVMQGLEKEREALVEIYKKTVSLLRSSRTHSEVEVKHERLHGHLSRGLIAPTLVIELHRQIFEFTTSLHEQEATALTTLLRLRQMHGTDLLEGIR